MEKYSKMRNSGLYTEYFIYIFPSLSLELKYELPGIWNN